MSIQLYLIDSFDFPASAIAAGKVFFFLLVRKLVVTEFHSLQFLSSDVYLREVYCPKAKKIIYANNVQFFLYSANDCSKPLALIGA